MTRLREDESGGATVFACFALAALVAVTAGLVHVGGAVAARHRAQAAADLAALAAASALSDGDESPCEAAVSIAVRMGATVPKCTVSGWDVVVGAEVRVGSVSFVVGPARAIARAGPAE
ncbi:Rv3654c family TadE-like protein [Rhodococcus sp. TAF43]|uniref:Rv3654c family TadE-like protein n=1 Tax=unclassified Rhodococcus (in: high G+C Gram-positive bacteria) TaxID=192944 RepID=UPI000E2E4098|nr:MULTISPECIES: Rv3654c family TadE-like protein [unclassified Rhodococcus (in: high G+C Gram-positive bacteria)]RDI28039.1 secretion/DNA translocation related TadE-like protein [Rhodococcus sp. AG1013]